MRILNCPFCGGEAEIINYSVHCNNPYCEAQPFTAGQSEPEAIAAWNKRAVESAEAASAVPAQQGKWLPKEPTEAMSLAGEQALMARAKPLITWAEHLTHVWVAMYDAAAPAAPDAAVPAEPDMLAICTALGFDPTNHHNAAKCPYCRPVQPGERELPKEMPDVCDGKEQDAFEQYLHDRKMSTQTHPVLWRLFLDPKSYAAREAWKAAISYCRAAITSVTKETKK